MVYSSSHHRTTRTEVHLANVVGNHPLGGVSNRSLHGYAPGPVYALVALNLGIVVCWKLASPVSGDSFGSSYSTIKDR